MKKISILLFCLCFATTAFSQFGNDFECPGGAWCHPDGAGLGGVNGLLGGMTEAGDAVGKDLNKKVKDSGSDEGVWGAIVDWIRCSYGEGTAQAADCSDAESQAQSLPRDYQSQMNKLKIDGVRISPDFIPAYFSDTQVKKTLRNSLNKMKRGQMVEKKMGGGHTLSLRYKYYTRDGKGVVDYVVVLNLYNKRKKLVATPVLVATKKGKVYLAELQNTSGK